MSLRLRAFNLFLKLSSYLGLSKLHLSEDLVAGFKRHSLRLDTVIAYISKKYHQPLMATEHSRWQWVGDWRRKKRYILYLHGGGFCAHLPATFRYWADRLATLNDASVLLVDYPLAPESPYPAGLDACLEAYRWMVEDQNLDPRHIIIGGDSAGGNLAMATLLRIKQANLPLPACAFALSPSLDLTLSSPSMTENAKTDVMGNIDLLTRIAQNYAPERHFLDGTVSPLFGDYRDFPPIHLQVSAEELLRDDSVRFYEKFKDDTPVELVLWDDVPHCHQIFGFLPEAALARARLQSFIAAQF